LSFEIPALLLNSTIGVVETFDLRFSNEFLWNNILACFVAVHLYGMASLLQENAFKGIAPIIKWAAGGSFSLYLVHYPVMMCLAALDVWPTSPLLYDVAFLGVTFVICYVFAALFERQLPLFRSLLIGRFPTLGQLATNRAR
jgi:peptidoglycan/LPS O-acetylase OafA/YrhL